MKREEKERIGNQFSSALTVGGKLSSKELSVVWLACWLALGHYPQVSQDTGKLYRQRKSHH